MGRFVEKHLGSKNLEESLIPLALVASDISTGEKVILKTGSLSQALMALKKVRSMIDEAEPSSLEQVEAKFFKWLRV